MSAFSSAGAALIVFCAKLKLLIVDELRYLPFEPNAAHLFFPARVAALARLVKAHAEGSVA